MEFKKEKADSITQGSFKIDKKIAIEDGFNPEFYELDKNDSDSFLGRGGVGEVFTAKLRNTCSRNEFPSEVAVKTVQWKIRGKYDDNEFNLLEGREYLLKNENLVKLFYISTKVVRSNIGLQYIYMEQCDLSLEEYVHTSRLSLGDIRHVATGVLRGLDHLHSHQVIHSNIKEPNILLKKRDTSTVSIQDMTIKIGDFHLSKWTTTENQTATPNMGTYLAPEVLLSRDEGQACYNTPCDIWALGVLIYQQMMNGGKEKHMFACEQEITNDELDRFVNAKIMRIPEVDLQSFLRLCLKKNPKERETAQELLKHDFINSE